MIFQKLEDLSRKPPVFERGTSPMWDDPHISQYMLEAHLNPDWDAASRKKAAIEKTVEWLHHEFVQQPADILDLGCGPGLYAQRLAEMGHHVVGMDFSRRSIEYASAQAAIKDLEIQYIYQDYLTMDYQEAFDTILIIYCDFGALTNQERDHLLHKIHRALKPGGVFIFDVFNEEFARSKQEGRQWNMKEEGFWSAQPYLELAETFHYPEEHACLDQYIILTEAGQINLYRNWDHYYSIEELRQLLSRFHFADMRFFTDVVDGDDSGSSQVTFTAAYRR